jgi:CHAT domain-containing protein
VIFHSAPLIKQQDKGGPIPLHDSTLDFETERRMILETFKRNEIGADIRFDAATTEKLLEVLDSRPKIMHISCHGYYDESKAQNFYLAFEHHT